MIATSVGEGLSTILHALDDSLSEEEKKRRKKRRKKKTRTHKSEN
jgi:uncharacterized metal-binding protein